MEEEGGAAEVARVTGAGLRARLADAFRWLADSAHLVGGALGNWSTLLKTYRESIGDTDWMKTEIGPDGVFVVSDTASRSIAVMIEVFKRTPDARNFVTVVVNQRSADKTWPAGDWQVTISRPGALDPYAMLSCVMSQLQAAGIEPDFNPLRLLDSDGEEVRIQHLRSLRGEIRSAVEHYNRMQVLVQAAWERKQGLTADAADGEEA